MKQKKLNSGKVVSYGFSDPEMHKALRARRHTVIADKKKQASKQICRSRSRRDQADFFVSYRLLFNNDIRMNNVW